MLGERRTENLMRMKRKRIEVKKVENT